MKKEKDVLLWWDVRDPLKRKREWIIYKSKTYLLKVSLDTTDQAEARRGRGLYGVKIRYAKRSFLRRVIFWFARRKFKDLTIKELKKLSAADQKKHLERKYYLHGIIPYLQ